MIDTSAFIETLVAMIGQVLPCYYERAKKDAEDQYCVVGGINANDLSAGDLTMFDVDFWGDDRAPDATVAIEYSCDKVRNLLQNAIIRKEGVFAGHIGFEGRDTTDDRETDLIHRRMFFSARLFYL